MPANSFARYEPRPPTPTTATLMRSFAPSTRPEDAALPGFAAKALAATPNVAPTLAAFFMKSLRLTDGWFSAIGLPFFLLLYLGPGYWCRIKFYSFSALVGRKGNQIAMS